MASSLRRVRALAAVCLIEAAICHAPFGVAAPSDPTAKEAIAQGEGAMRSGDFERAWRDFAAAAAAARSAGDTETEIDALSRNADAHLALGESESAAGALQAALGLAKGKSDASRTAVVLDGLGRSFLQAGLLTQSLASLQDALKLARSESNRKLESAILNNVGLVRTAEGRHDDAEKAYVQAAEQGTAAGAGAIVARALANAAKASLERRRLEPAAGYLVAAATQARSLQDSHDKSFTLSAIGQIYRHMYGLEPTGEYLRLAYRAYKEAAETAGNVGDSRGASYALGYLGQLYEDQKEIADAQSLTRQALSFAQQVGAPEILFLWHWQMARLQKAQRDIGGAQASYRQAIYHLQAVRQDLQGGSGESALSFRRAYGPVYFEMADILLSSAVTAKQGESAQALRAEARSTIELLKAAELRDYFQDDCVSSFQSRISSVDSLGERTAAVYPVLLEDRTEVLVTIGGEIRQYTLPIGASALAKEVHALRELLVKRTTREYLARSRRIYDWLFRPMDHDLEALGIDTIVFVPDGALRTIPIGALYDGKHYLIEKYAISVIPGLTLTDARPLRREGLRALLTGMTRPLRGFPGLPNVGSELTAISALYPGKVLQDAAFSVDAIERELAARPYSIVHIASHAIFDRDPRKTFLVAFDQSLTMGRLEKVMGLGQYRKEPVELLTLSACETAAGDDRAALGMAGAAVKAGARSVLASLWFVNDAATSVLVSEFYRQLSAPGVSKARALQLAQKKLLSDRLYRHPGLWSPFLLIGNWL